jgi:ABC-type multidrug transport system fused ATPase/permease subunit
MKKNGSTTIMNWALAVAVAGVALGAVQYYFKTREARSLQAQVMNYQQRQVVLNNLVAECLEYSKRNPSIDSILEANNLKAKSGTGAKALTK